MAEMMFWGFARSMQHQSDSGFTVYPCGFRRRGGPAEILWLRGNSTALRRRHSFSPASSLDHRNAPAGLFAWGDSCDPGNASRRHSRRDDSGLRDVRAFVQSAVAALRTDSVGTDCDPVVRGLFAGHRDGGGSDLGPHCFLTPRCHLQRKRRSRMAIDACWLWPRQPGGRPLQVRCSAF